MAALISAFAQAQEPAFGKQPNIILVVTDDQGYGDTSCHGHPVLKTPNIDKLATQSVRFTRFQVSPTCAPTRSALMSGRAPFYVGVTHTIQERERMRLGVPTLPEMLKGAGYTTGIFGKWHLGDQDPYRPDQRGFDEVFIHGAGGIGQGYPGSCGDAPGNKYFDPAILHNNVFEKTEGYCTDIFFDKALEWIATKKDKERFFAYIPTNAPHAPLVVADSYKLPFIEAGMTKRQAAFYGMVANIDENVGKLTDKLEEWGIAEDTLLIFMTDNGPAGSSNFNAGMKGKKGSVDEGGTRVPFFVRWPGVLEAGVDVDRIARHTDVLPTLAAITGGVPKASEELHGRSLVPLLRDPTAKWADRMFFFHRGRWGKGKAAASKRNGFAVRNQRFRLVGPSSLYDMENDGGQKTNVIDQHADVAKQMLAAYDAWFEAALPNMVNEDAALTGHNTFKLMFWEQYGLEVPPVRQRGTRKGKRKNKRKKN